MSAKKEIKYLLEQAVVDLKEASRKISRVVDIADENPNEISAKRRDRLAYYDSAIYDLKSLLEYL
ncbi:hypothetical protein PBI_MRMAGOO_13 [Mycobacterium phage MrMagoo]|uniref:Uncharacterized protein n=1 Tax=Mycobacterium phage MrMagoo TaxID=1927020 RepID=A0A1L6BYE0_9CAUD|nr:hypothetical protein J4U04_gp013 [Mycobacterium phage MrMagoo]APQ42118.1 hypothetical protein PBI_MRMAGOO_13 [Mycobacterium phage MrMagoo]ARM70194.1 hypothetical protein SEA_GARDENSALSA_13 [Mycobacterium phage GardenSalsa]